MAILWLGSYPRSGNTLARIILWRAYGRKTRSVYNDNALDKKGLQDLGLVFDLGTLSRVKGFREEEQWYPIKTHACLDNTKGVLPLPTEPAIYIHRDGRDALLSHACFLQAHHNRQRKARAILYQLVHGIKKGARPWGDAVLSWANRPRTSYVSYRELVADPLGSISRCVRELGLGWEMQGQVDLPTFEQLHEAAPAFFREGVHGQWKKAFTTPLYKAFWARHGEGMEHYGYLR